MSAQLVKFFLCSVCLHAAAFGLLFQATPVSHSLENNARTTRPPVTARLITSEAQQLALPIATEPKSEPEPKFVLDQKLSVEDMLTQASQVIERLGFLPDLESLNNTGEQHTDTAPFPPTAQDYLPVDRLTLRPTPVAPIDLNVAALNQIAIAGKLELTVLVNAEGFVVDAFTSIAAENPTREFADRVVALFKNARFKPAELDGRPVKSQLQIIVVSEKLAAIDERK